MKTWAQFLDYLLPDVPGCGVPFATQALRLAAEEFCDKTLIWAEQQDEQFTQAGVIEYDFDFPSDRKGVKMLSLLMDGRSIDPIAKEDLNPTWRTDTATKRCMFSVDLRTFYVLPPPGAGISLITECVLKPTSTAPGLPDFMFEDHRELIALGAKYRLMASPKKPWTDLELAGINRAEFNARCGDLAWSVERSRSRATRRSKPHFF